MLQWGTVWMKIKVGLCLSIQHSRSVRGKLRLVGAPGWFGIYSDRSLSSSLTTLRTYILHLLVASKQKRGHRAGILVFVCSPDGYQLLEPDCQSLGADHCGSPGALFPIG